MQDRVISAIIYLGIFIPLLFTGGWVFEVFSLILALVVFSELVRMKELPMDSFGAITGYVAISFFVLSDRLVEYVPFLTNANVLILSLIVLLIYMIYSKLHIQIDDITLLLFGVFYIGNAFQTLVAIRRVEFTAIFYIMIIIWTTDTGAYLVGKKWGRTPLASSISPNKTLEGSIGGIATSVLASYLFLSVFPVTKKLYPNFAIVILMSISAQMGDLVESAIKRHYEVKDTGRLLPGHGGLFDRLDSLIFVMNLLKLLMDFGIFSY